MARICTFLTISFVSCLLLSGCEPKDGASTNGTNGTETTETTASAAAEETAAKEAEEKELLRAIVIEEVKKILGDPKDINELTGDEAKVRELVQRELFTNQKNTFDLLMTSQIRKELDKVRTNTNNAWKGQLSRNMGRIKNELASYIRKNGVPVGALENALEQLAAIKRIEEHYGDITYGKAGEVVTVEISDAMMTDDDLKLISSLTSCTKLAVYGTQISDKGMEYLNKMTWLKDLAIVNTGITDDGLAKLKDLQNLTRLSLRRSPNLTDAGLRNLSSLPKIEQLVLMYNNFGDEAVKIVAEQYPNLTLLDIRACQVGNDALAEVGKLHNLKVLKVRLGIFDDEGFAKLATCKELLTLEVQDCNLTEVGLAVIKNFTKMRELTIMRCNATDEGIGQLTGLNDLRFLSLRANGTITGTCLKAFVNCDKLAELNIEETIVDDAAMPFIAQMKGLEILKMWATRITGKGLAELVKCEALREINLKNIPTLKSEDVQYLGPAKIPTLEKVDLSENYQLDAVMVRYFTDVGYGLKEIIFTGCKLTAYEINDLKMSLSGTRVVFD